MAVRRGTKSVALGVAGVLALAGVFLLLKRLGPESAYKWWVLVMGVSAGAGSFIAWIRRAMGVATSSEAQLAEAQDYLRKTVADEWRAEGERREYWSTSSIELTWRATTRPVTSADPPASLVGGVLSDLPLVMGTGEVTRLVIIGEPGSGKTFACVNLLLALIEISDSTTALPVLVSAAAWNPKRETLDAFMVRQLEQDYPGIRARRFGRKTAQRLISQQYDRAWILPLIDGLDELDPAHRKAALRRLRGLKGSYVITSRAGEYESLILEEDLTIDSELVVEIDPVDSNSAAAFILSGRPKGSTRWRAVTAALSSRSPVSIDEALRNPLMLSLARISYDAGDTDPSELLDTTRFPTRESVQSHILDRYLDRIYADETHHGKHGPAVARGYLVFLAEHLEKLGTPNFAWWELQSAVSGLGRRLLRAACITGVCLVLIGKATASGASAAVVSGALFLSLSIVGYIPKRLGGVYLLALADAVAFWIAGRLSGNSSAGLVGAIGVMIGIIVASRSGDPGTLRLPKQFHSRALESRQDVWLVGLAGLGAGLLGGIAATSSTGDLTSATIVGAAGGLTTVFTILLVFSGRPRITSLAKTPSESLRSDTVWTALFSLSFGVIVAVALAIAVGLTAVGGERPIGYWIGIAVAIGTVGSVSGAASVSASGAYFWAVCILAVRRRVPFLFMTFLEQAQKGGLLRQVGSMYQFRHRLLADRLIATNPTD